MMGFDVAPVAPRARLSRTKSGSMESSHNLVPDSIRDRKPVAMVIAAPTREWNFTASR